MGWKRSTLTALAAGLLLAGPVAAPAVVQARATVLAPAKPEALGFSSERLAKMDAAMKALVDRGAAPGVITYVARHGRTAHYSIYGKADLASGAPLKEDTIFRMYSQTKPVTGVAMMILFEEGRWKLDEPVTKYVPEFKNLRVFKGLDAKGKMITEAASRPPTMREIMTHTGGFAYGLTTDNPVDAAYRESGMLGSPTLREAMSEAAKLPLANQPGEQWRYSIAVDIQGYIVEKLSGQSLPEFMQSRIFGPLGMKDTAFWLPPEKQSRMASLYMLDRQKGIVPADGFMVLDISKPPTAANGGGGLVSTVADYARFAQMLCNGGELDGVRILSPSTVKLMATNHLTDAQLAKQPLGPGVGFGLDFGVVMDPAAAGTPAGMGSFSWGGAAGTWFWVDPENDLFVMGMIQVIGGGQAYRLDELSQQFVYAALVDPSK
ncbi:serine hydrolase [Caulobacter sp. SLTY]|uniref:serine hydrolase domain-containing protein n=1 Tax=Caulobacter sp. SLTY TaxID=2683262 RepID=UPI001412F1FC|nr:serine hydrolase domain-containing protein [Caulobacter sp. SLTY]NBB15395.1 serine hydrolase [Caulobacter sp. SLTY]